MRKRLHQTLGSQGTQVDALTFHALAMKLTKLKICNAPKEIQGQARFKWLLEQAIIHLQENHPEYQYILVDEYQDINEFQYQIITQLAGFDHQDEDQSQKSFLMAVGDDDQNLYEWNGANIEFIRRFREDYKIRKENVIPLVQNYRSRPTIVDFANHFIEQAISPENRLKGVNERIQAVNTEAPGKVFLGEYQHLYDAAKWIVDKIADILTQPEIRKEKIAVLAHRWEDLHFLQHIFREDWGNDQDIAYQLYNAKDELRPIKSLVGQKVVSQLQKEPDLHVENPQAHLEQLRQELGYSNRDAAWSALIHTLEGHSEITQEDIIYLLEEARPLRPGQVVLSTFHSAKGSEFSHAFVLDNDFDNHFINRKQLEERARKLYVGFTRAKEELYVLFPKNMESKFPVLKKVLTNMNSPHIEKIVIEPVTLPSIIHYHWFLEPRDLFLSHSMVTNPFGQKRISTYAQDWGKLFLGFGNNGQVSYICSCDDLHNDSKRGGVVATLSNTGKEQLQKYIHFNKHLAVRGHTVFRVERNDQFFQDTGEQGQIDHHYVVLPYFEVEEVLNATI